MPKVKSANTTSRTVPDHMLSQSLTSEDSIRDVGVHSVKRQKLFKRTSVFKPDFPDDLFNNSEEDVRVHSVKRQKLLKYSSEFPNSSTEEDGNDSVGIKKKASKRAALFRRVSTFQPEFPTLLFDEESSIGTAKEAENFCTSTPFGKTLHIAGNHKIVEISPIPLPPRHEKTCSISEKGKADPQSTRLSVNEDASGVSSIRTRLRSSVRQTTPQPVTCENVELSEHKSNKSCTSPDTTTEEPQKRQNTRLSQSLQTNKEGEVKETCVHFKKLVSACTSTADLSKLFPKTLHTSIKEKVDACTSTSDLSKATSVDVGVQEQENNSVQESDLPVLQNIVNKSFVNMSVGHKKRKAHPSFKENTYDSHIHRCVERAREEEREVSCFDNEIHLNINKTSTYIANSIRPPPVDAEADKSREREASCLDKEQNSGSVSAECINGEILNSKERGITEINNTNETSYRQSNLSKSVAGNIIRETEILHPNVNASLKGERDVTEENYTNETSNLSKSEKQVSAREILCSDVNEPLDEERGITEVNNTNETLNRQSNVSKRASLAGSITEINLEANRDSVNGIRNRMSISSKLDVSKSKSKTVENFNKPGTSKVPKKSQGNQSIDTESICTVRRSQRVRKTTKLRSHDVIYTNSVHIANIFNNKSKVMTRSLNKRRTTRTKKSSKVSSDNTQSTTSTSRFDNATNVNNVEEDYNHNEEVPSVHGSPPKKRQSNRLSSASKASETAQNNSKCVSFINTSSKSKRKSQPEIAALELNDTVKSTRQNDRRKSKSVETCTEPPKLVTVKENSDLAICFTGDHDGGVKTGFLEIKGGGQKEACCSKTQSIMYTVSDGKALFCINHNQRVKLVKGCDFLVKKGWTYSIQNVNETRRLLLHFIKFFR